MGKKRQNPNNGKEVVIPYARGKLSSSKGDYDFYYPKGLRWGCKRCGECCRDASHRPRRILLLSNDVERLEKAGEKDFRVEAEGEEPFIAEMRKVGGACLYLMNEGCKVYPSRALLCRTYPFWIERDGRTFEIKFDTRCKGINRGGELKEDFYSDLIMQALDQRGNA
jgi:Fe-S-cluster containining protein